MDVRNRNDGIEIPPEITAEITRLYDQGLYVQAGAKASAFSPVSQWRGTAARLIGGRLADHLYAPRLSRWLHGRAWRGDRANPEAAYYYGLTVWQERGPLAAWRFLGRLPSFPEASPERRSDLLTLRAGILGGFRDFDSAAKLLDEAEEIDRDRAWLWVRRGALHEKQDAYEAALEATRHALELRPWYRPAIQSAAHQLQLLGRDAEALDLLQNASRRMECAAIDAQLATLQTELGQHAAAFETWQRVRDLSPWMEPEEIERWEARMSDANYFIGSLAAAADAAERAKNHFHTKLVDRLRAPAPDARRVLLSVGFVRQHELTCAPATLSAISHFWGVPIDHLALAAAICYEGTPDHMERAWALENGWHAREFRVTWEVLVALLDRGIPFTVATVETQSAHLQAVVGYDSFRGTICVRDPYERTHGEWLGTEFLQNYAASGPRGMLLLPMEKLSLLEGIELPDAALYDDYYALQRALHHYDREEAQQHLSALESAAPAHRLTLQAQRSVAGYDGSLPRQLAAVENLLTSYPENGNFLWSKFILLRQLDRRADCHEFLRQRCADAKSESLFWRERASELSADARCQVEARHLLERALCRQPMDPDHLQARANLHWEQREFAEATELYRFAATLRDKTDQYSRSYFIAARHLRQTQTAFALLTQRFEKFGTQSSQPVRLLFWALTVLDRQTDAFAKLESALTQRPNDGELLLFAADAFARHGDHARGLALLHAAEKRASRVAWLRTSANLADYRCDLPAALALWQAILTEEPLSMEAQRAVTRLLAETEGRAAALAHLVVMCTRFEHHIGLHELWAEWARRESNTAVEPVLRRLLALHPEHAWAHRELASVCSDLHRPAEAAASLDIAEQLEPRSPSTPGIRAQVALEAGKLGEAREHAQAALRLSVDYDYAIRTLFAASDTFEEKKAAVAFVHDELIRQVVFGDGLLAFRGVAYDIIEPADLLTNLRDALAARPDLWHAWSAVSQQLLDMQQLDEALGVAREATERFPLLPRLWLDLAQVHRTRREREKEIPPLERALQLSPAWGHASRQLADTHQRMGRYENAEKVLEQAIAAAPLDPYNYGCLADVLHHLGRSDEAMDRLEHCLKLDPGYEWAWEMLHARSPEQGEKNRALVLARDLTVLRGGEARSWLILARSLPKEAVAERLDALDRATALQPRFAEAHDCRAVLLAEAGRYEEAMAACAPAAYGDHPPTLLQGRAAWVEACQGRYRVAIARMRGVVAEAPEYYWGWNMLADWCAADRDFDGAEEAVRRMIRLAPRGAVPLGYLADLQLQKGEEDAAYESMRRAYELDPTYAFAGFTLFDRHLEKRDLAAAGQVLEVLSTHLRGPRTLAARARYHASLGQREAALRTLNELARVPEADSRALHTGAAALVEAHWGHEVEDCLEEMLEDPDINPEVGPIWIRRCIARGEWKSCKRLYAIPAGSELGRRTRIAFIEGVAESGLGQHLRSLLRQEKETIRNETSLWGAVGYAYTHMSRWTDAVRWMQGADRRPGVRPWMLYNLATAHRELKNDAQALAVNRRALTLTRDGTTPKHQLWVAFHAALAGNIPALDQELAELREHELGDYEQKLLILVKALRAVHTASAADRRRVFYERCREIARRRREGIYDDAVLNRARRRCLDVLSRAAGDRWRLLRPWMPDFAGWMTTDGARLTIIFGVIFTVILVRLFDDVSFRSVPNPTPPPIRLTPPPPLPGATPSPPRLDQPITIQLGPPEAPPPNLFRSPDPTPP
jgi:tetratricopeptide (TPR) repeat protein